MALETGQKIRTVEFENIPQEMRDIPSWLLWKKVPTGKGYDTKVPIQTDGSNAMTNEPSTWTTFDNVQQAYENGTGDGIGIVFNNSHRLYALDIDGTTDHEYIDTHGQHTYSEYSPSGNGVHVYFMADKPKDSRKNGLHDDSLELFSGSGFTTVTGNMRTSADEIIDNDSLIEKLIADEFPPDKYSLASVDLTEEIEPDTPRHNLTKEEVIKAISKSQFKDDVAALMQGDISNYHNDPSAADWALISHLAYWTARNESMIYEIFSESGLYGNERGKRPTQDGYELYVMQTIRKAVLKKTKVYEPHGVTVENDFEININQDGTVVKSEDGSTKKITKHGWWVYESDENGEAKGKPKFIHHYMAWYILQNYNIVRYPDADGDLYIYNEKEGYYEVDKVTRKLKNIIRGLSANLKNNQVTEVRNYIVDMSRVETEINTDYAAVGNGLVKFEDKSFHEFTPKVFVTQKIPTNYNANAYDEFINKTLHKAASYHKPTIENIKEMFGMIIYPKMIVPKMIYLLGVSANNGKSTSLNMARKALDPGGQISAVSPQKLASNDFAGASIYGKMANIVDDLPDISVVDTGHLKAAITGGYIEIEAKNKGSYSVQMNTPFIIASNHYPKFKEHGVQINKRLHIIPFEYNFVEDDEYISESESMQLIETDSAKEYVLKLGIDALHNMLQRSGEILTPNDKAEHALDEFSDFNNPLSEYFVDYDKEYFEDTTGMNAYRDYETWCQLRMVRDVLSLADYKTAVMNHYEFTWKKARYKINDKWVTRPGFKPRK